MNARDKRAERAQLGILWDVPFFASGCMRLPIVWDESVKTACTDGKRVIWAPSFFDKCQDQELVTVMCEEVGHCQLGHLWRHPPEAKESQEAWRHWNWCCDQEVRWMMRDWSEVVQQQKRFDPFPFPQPSENFLPSDEYRGMAAEAIFRATWQNGVSGQGAGNKNASGGKPGGKKRQSVDGNGQLGEFSPSDGTPADQDKLATEWEADACRSARYAKSMGNVPGSVDRLVSGILSPVVPWWEVLRELLREPASDDWDLMRPEIPLSDTTGFIMPSLHSERCGPIVFATDTSGSITDADLTRYLTEKQYCLDELKPSGLMDMYCDTRVSLVKEYVPGDAIGREAPGGGGTDLRSVFEHLREREIVPRALVVMTDLETPFPDVGPDYPVIWITDGDKQAPFGQTIKIQS